MDAALQNPLIVTLTLDPQSQKRFEAERQQYFPAHLNRIPAHVSLFHALPGEHMDDVGALLAETADATQTFPVSVEAVRRYGRGVGYSLSAPGLQQVHARLRQAWLPWLTPQDRQGFRPHVMVQNKASQEASAMLLLTLSSRFQPWEAQAVGLDLWVYEGGPWSAIDRFLFRGAEGGQA